MALGVIVDSSQIIIFELRIFSALFEFSLLDEVQLFSSGVGNLSWEWYVLLRSWRFAAIPLEVTGQCNISIYPYHNAEVFCKGRSYHCLQGHQGSNTSHVRYYHSWILIFLWMLVFGHLFRDSIVSAAFLLSSWASKNMAEFSSILTGGLSNQKSLPLILRISSVSLRTKFLQCTHLLLCPSWWAKSSHNWSLFFSNNCVIFSGLLIHRDVQIVPQVV